MSSQLEAQRSSSRKPTDSRSDLSGRGFLDDFSLHHSNPFRQAEKGGEEAVVSGGRVSGGAKGKGDEGLARTRGGCLRRPRCKRGKNEVCIRACPHSFASPFFL